MANESCATCGNTYDKTFRVTTADGETFHFDSIECATHRIARTCDHCGCRILGHGMEASDRMYCCAHCAHEAGVTAVADRA
jgi:hypothetical protein